MTWRCWWTKRVAARWASHENTGRRRGLFVPGVGKRDWVFYAKRCIVGVL